MPRFEKGSEEAKAWAAKMKAARESKKAAPQLKASPAGLARQKKLASDKMKSINKVDKMKQMKGGFLQPDELPASMRFVADPMDIINTKEETIDGGNLKSMIEAFRRKWASK